MGVRKTLFFNRKHTKKKKAFEFFPPFFFLFHSSAKQVERAAIRSRPLGEEKVDFFFFFVKVVVGEDIKPKGRGWG